MSPSVIVNADDWGLTEDITEAIARCFEVGAISSTTAMVWMSGSRTAERLAREGSLPVGLHLNLDTEFTDPNAPRSAQELHARVVPWFQRTRARMPFNANPRFQRDLNELIRVQLNAFSDAYGTAPTHVDGHHHVHLSPNVLLSSALAPGTKVRSTRWGPSTWPHEALRSLRLRLIERRFRTTEQFYDVRTLHQQWGTDRLALLHNAMPSSVEVMVHPGFEDELPVLLGSIWREAISQARVISFADLEPDASSR